MGLALWVEVCQRTHGKSRLYETIVSTEHHTTMALTSALNFKDRAKAAAIHLALSLGVAALAALLVFGLWYPYPYRDSSGGRELFLLVVAVDIILGPLITLTVFNRKKPRSELVRDLTLVGLIQLAALAYGLWTVAVARPVHMVFEFDRFRVVHAIEVPQELLDRAPANVKAMPLTGPNLLAVRTFRDAQEESAATLMALQGVSLSARPDLWQAYDQARPRVLAAAKPLAELRQRFPNRQGLIHAAVHASEHPDDKLVYLPMVERKSFWTVLLDAQTADIRGFIELDSF